MCLLVLIEIVAVVREGCRGEKIFWEEEIWPFIPGDGCALVNSFTNECYEVVNSPVGESHAAMNHVYQ